MSAIVVCGLPSHFSARVFVAVVAVASGGGVRGGDGPEIGWESEQMMLDYTERSDMQITLEEGPGGPTTGGGR